LLAGSTYTDLEFDIKTGKRGERDSYSVSLIKRLTGCEEASVVNNNAAALLITLNTLAEGREVIISRGELIEIGGSFRLPEIIEKSGCILREVGTTNRTHAADYVNAIGENTALILKVHTSNYTIEGFTSEVGLKELVSIGAEQGLPVVEDLGSGALLDLKAYGLPHEPLVGESLRAGAGCVTFSGDKLLGGPQAGLIAGSRVLVERIRKNPLKRSLRAGKLSLAVLEETLKLYLNPEKLQDRLPALRLMTRPVEEIEEIAEKAAEIITKAGVGASLSAKVEAGSSVIGGGSLPGRTLPTRVVSIKGVSSTRLQKAFLHGSPPIIGRISNDAFILDPRTIIKREKFYSALKDVLSGLKSD
ncbi:MAG: L-seryl-tRNA(Sec) selenium transferase, partial [Thermodesulfobacteriota bacterium]